MKTRLELDLGGQILTAKFGVTFLGILLKEKDKTIDELFKDYQKNVMSEGQDIMYHAVKYGTPNFELSQDEFNDLLDENNGFNNLMTFIQLFTLSLNVDTPDDGKTVGKPKPKVKKS